MTLLSRGSTCTAFRSKMTREGGVEGSEEDEEERLTSILKSPPEEGRGEGGEGARQAARLRPCVDSIEERGKKRRKGGREGGGLEA